MPAPRLNGAVPGGLYTPISSVAVLAVSAGGRAAGTWLVKAPGSRVIMVEHSESNLMGESCLISDGRRSAVETRGDRKKIW